MTKKASLFSNLFFGCTITFILFILLEGILRLIPQPWLGIKNQSTLLAPPDRGSILLTKNGYRGKRPCTNCPEKMTRIVAMGGSSTFGVPMYYSEKTYSAVLQRLLSKRRPDDHFEVLNAGVAGFGIWQIVEALENVILNDKPDIVLLCAWFNDASYIPGWYGFQGKSDYEAYQEVKRLRAIESNSIYQIVSATRTYALLKTLLSRAAAPQKPQQKKQRKRRSNVDEFKLGVERFLELSRKHNFRPVFVFEALNRTKPRSELTKNHRYYKVLEELGARYNVTIVDTLTAIAGHHGEWLFYDFIHPNEHGHQVIAEAIYETLFK